MNKFAVLAASLIASFALAFAVYSAENNPNTSGFPRVVASVRLTNLTQPIPTTRILNAPRTGLYRVSSYMATTTPSGSGGYGWSLCLGWTDEAGIEQGPFDSIIYANQIAPSSYGMPFITGNGPFIPQPAFPFEALAGTSISYAVTPFANGGSGTYELFISVEQLQ